MEDELLGQGDKAALLSTDVVGKLTLHSVPSPDFSFFFFFWLVCDLALTDCVTTCTLSLEGRGM